MQLDAYINTIADTINTFNRLEPMKAVLFANSLFDETPELLINRDRFWKYSMHGYNPHNIDMYDIELRSADELIEYIKSESIYCLERDGKYINFAPMLLTDYFSSDKIKGEYYEDGRYHEIEYEPRIDDLEYLRSFKFEDLTYRGTIEFRSACEQPVSEIMAHSALHAGLAERLGELTELLSNDTVIYRRGYSPAELRVLLSRKELPGFINKGELSGLLMKILIIAEKGLSDRGFDEGEFLAPLYSRAEKLLSPAREILNGLEAGESFEKYILKFAGL